jgi:hypothetical protein
VHCLASNKGPRTGKIMKQILAMCPQCACATARIFDGNVNKVVARSMAQNDGAKSVHLPTRGTVMVEVPESGGEVYLPPDAEKGCEIRYQVSGATCTFRHSPPLLAPNAWHRGTSFTLEIVRVRLIQYDADLCSVW